jgi:hypothetical protein
VSTNKEEREHGQITSWTILTIRVAGVTYLDVPATVQCTPLSFPERWASRPISFNEMQSNQTPEQLISPTQVLDASHPKHKAGSYAGEQQWIFISRRPTANQQCHPRTSGGVNYVDLSSWFAPSVRLVGGQLTHSWFFKSPPFQLTTQLGYTTCSLLQSWHYCWISLFVNLSYTKGYLPPNEQLHDCWVAYIHQIQLWALRAYVRRLCLIISMHFCVQSLWRVLNSDFVSVNVNNTEKLWVVNQ